MSENTGEGFESSNPSEHAESDHDREEHSGDEGGDGNGSGANDSTSRNRRDRIGETLKAAPEAKQEINEEWTENPEQAYFFGYSVLAAIAMLAAMRAGGGLLLYGVFAVYAITAIPALYIYEETPYFSREENPFLSSEQSSEADTEESDRRR